MTKNEILSKAKQIRFNTDEVRAILDGRKTTTRQVVKPANARKSKYMGGYYQGNGLWISTDGYIKDYSVSTMWQEIECYKKNYAPYKVGDILYVKETWAYGSMDGKPEQYFYRADYNEKCPVSWSPSIHMPKEAARIFLKVTNIRVERLQDITDEQAEKEGCNDYSSTANGFAYLWDCTVKKSDLDKYGWDANPWVWVIEFERID